MHTRRELYLIFKEAVNNAAKHAYCSNIEIDFYSKNGRFFLRVSDDGQAVPGAGPEPGFGLLGMAERAQLLGGSLSAGPGPEGGWVVEAVLPVETLA